MNLGQAMLSPSTVIAENAKMTRLSKSTHGLTVQTAIKFFIRLDLHF